VLFGVDSYTFWMVLQWTLVFALLSTLLSFAPRAALLSNDQRLPERSLYRTLRSSPGASATITISGAVSSTTTSLLEPVPECDRAEDIPGWAMRFRSRSDPEHRLAFPFMMTACLGALQSIPDELNEAAVVDGAGTRSRFRYVTLPHLRFVITPLLIGTFAYQFNNFNVVYLLTAGNPAVENSDAGGTDIPSSRTPTS
jgi:ABC-type sugar transport system permease subunit